MWLLRLCVCYFSCVLTSVSSLLRALVVVHVSGLVFDIVLPVVFALDLVV